MAVKGCLSSAWVWSVSASEGLPAPARPALLFWLCAEKHPAAEEQGERKVVRRAGKA